MKAENIILAHLQNNTYGGEWNNKTKNILIVKRGGGCAMLGFVSSGVAILVRIKKSMDVANGWVIKIIELLRGLTLR